MWVSHLVKGQWNPREPGPRLKGGVDEALVDPVRPVGEGGGSGRCCASRALDMNHLAIHVMV